MVREYGRDDGVRVPFGKPPIFPALGDGEYLGVLAPDTLFEKDERPIDGPRPGVVPRLGLFLNGDSGRGSDGLALFRIGLEGRAPGPTDCENFGIVLTSGVSPFRLKFENEGVVGVGGKVSAVRDGDIRFEAR